MRGSYPIVTCDHEDGCTEWMLDHWSADVSNWKTFLDDWQYDPYRYDENKNPALCPKHCPALEPGTPVRNRMHPAWSGVVVEQIRGSRYTVRREVSLTPAIAEVFEGYLGSDFVVSSPDGSL